MGEKKSLEQILGHVDCGRREFLQKMLLATAVAVPLLVTAETQEARAVKLNKIQDAETPETKKTVKPGREGKFVKLGKFEKGQGLEKSKKAQ